VNVIPVYSSGQLMRFRHLIAEILSATKFHSASFHKIAVHGQMVVAPEKPEQLRKLLIER
jgi:hypothetical protein